MDHSDILALTTTVGTIEQARALARALVQARLAACVQFDAQVQSCYEWEGRLCEEPEVRLTIKSLPQRLPELQAFLAQHHPYALPQVLSWRMQATPAYAQWVAQALSAPAAAPGPSD